jgi:uncharacterized OsmC-like protein
MSTEISVRHEDGDRFAIDVRGHVVLVDQPTEAGGGDAGPTPTELFVAGLASCVAFYAERFLVRHGLPVAGLGVDCSFEMSEDRPARVASVDVRVRPPAGFPDERAPALERVIEHCTVHNTLRMGTEVRIGLAVEVPRAA